MKIRGHRPSLVLLSVMSAFTLAITLVSGLFGIVLRTVASEVKTTDISDQLGDRPAIPASPKGPLDILIMGSDTRAGQGRKYGQPGYYVAGHSDTTLLVHIYEDRKRVLVVSIPRDTIVRIPECYNSDGELLGSITSRFNYAFTRGGPGCTVKTVESITGITIEHFAVLDFRGFTSVVNALGGVEVCIPEDVNDNKSKLFIKAGLQTLNGEDSLAYVRTRFGLGDGGDISRISRQQDFLKSMVRKITSSKVLLDPIRLFRTLNEVAKSLTTDPALGSVEQMTALARSIAGIDPARIRFMTAPISTNPNDRNTVVFSTIEANKLWTALANDQGYEEPIVLSKEQIPDVPVNTVSVTVLNGSTIPGAATEVANRLETEGFKIAGTRNSELSVETSFIRASENQLPQARTLAKALGNDIEIQIQDSRSNDIKLFVGTNKVNVIGFPKIEEKESTWQQPQPTGSDERNPCQIKN